MGQDARPAKAQTVDLRKLLEAKWADLPERLLGPVTTPPGGTHEVVAGKGGSQFAEEQMVADPRDDTFQ